MKRARGDDICSEGGGGGGTLARLPFDVWYHFAHVVPADVLVDLARTPLCKWWMNMWMSARSMWQTRLERMPRLCMLWKNTQQHPLIVLRKLLYYVREWVWLRYYQVEWICPTRLPVLVHDSATNTMECGTLSIRVENNRITVAGKTHVMWTYAENGYIAAADGTHMWTAEDIFCYLLRKRAT